MIRLFETFDERAIQATRDLMAAAIHPRIESEALDFGRVSLGLPVLSRLRVLTLERDEDRGRRWALDQIHSRLKSHGMHSLFSVELSDRHTEPDFSAQVPSNVADSPHTNPEDEYLLLVRISAYAALAMSPFLGTEVSHADLHAFLHHVDYGLTGLRNSPMTRIFTPEIAIEHVKNWYWEGFDDDSALRHYLPEEIANATEATIEKYLDENHLSVRNARAMIDDAYWETAPPYDSATSPLPDALKSLTARLLDKNRRLSAYTRPMKDDDYAYYPMLVFHLEEYGDFVLEMAQEEINHTDQFGEPSYPFAGITFNYDVAHHERLVGFLDALNDFFAALAALIDYIDPGNYTR